MWVTFNGANSTEIEGSVVERVLNLYPEEGLINRPIFQEAFQADSIAFADLKEESEKILIPWQMFFLSTANLNTQITHIETQRQHKVSAKLMAKRRGAGDVTSKRIVDRLIRLQNFLTGGGTIPVNPFCESLRRVRTQAAAAHIVEHFEINREWMWQYRGKGAALKYLIKQVEAKGINVSQGVLTNKILPHHKVVMNNVYKNTSGFAIKDPLVPFVFLPSEVNPDEVESRQIYTLVYLLAVIGLDQYDYYLDKDFKAKILNPADATSARIYAITSEVLMPTVETDKLRGQRITTATRDELATKFKVSPLALVTTLRIRGVISKKDYEALKPPEYVPQTQTEGHPNQPRVSTSVSKFCGQQVYSALNTAIRSGTLTSIPAQHLMFGAANKAGYKKYCIELGL